MNRRQFLIGTAATAVALRVPTIAEAEYGLAPMMAAIPDQAIIADYMGYIVWAKDQTICMTGIRAEDFYK